MKTYIKEEIVMNEYLATKSHLTNKILEWVNEIQALEKQTDRLYKINLYLLRKYKDELIKEFDIDIPEGILDDPWFKLLESAFNQQITMENETLILSLITSKIEQKMNEEMPEPWYCYSFGGKINDI